MKLANPFQCVTCLWLLLLGGCPGAGDSGDTGNGGVTDSLFSDDERSAQIDKVANMVEGFDLNGDPAVSDQIAALLSTVPEIAEVKVYAGSVTAKFTDGEVLVVINTRPADIRPGIDEPVTKSIKADREISGPSPLTQSIYRAGVGTSTVMPKSKNVLLVNAMGTAYKDDTPQLKQLFAHAGYSVTLNGGTIDDFRDSVKDIGVLYVSSHGATLYRSILDAINKEVFEGEAETPRPTVPAEDSDGNDHFVIWTRTPITNETMHTYRDQVRAGRLAYLIGSNDKANGVTTRGRHFGITEAFVYDNWRLSANSLVYMDCCWSANARITNICFTPRVNASAYLGWNAPSYIEYASPSARFFFDRTLGANTYSPFGSLQRAFTVDQVYSKMEKIKRRNLPPDPDLPTIKNLDMTLTQSITEAYSTKWTGKTYAELVLITRAPVADVVLRPGILNVKAGSNLITIQGTFSEDPPNVTMGGTPLTVRDGATSEQIVCDLPSGASGKVVVEDDGRFSNPRALSQWNLTFHRTFMDYPTQGNIDCPSCFWEGTIHYTMRADAAATRLDVDEPLVPGNYIGGADAGDIEVTNAGGTFPIGQGTSVTLAPNPDDGAALIGTCVGFLPTLDNNYLGACFFVKGTDGVIAFSPTLSAEGLLWNYHGGQYDGIVEPVQVLYSGNQIGNELLLPLSPNFNIAAGNQSTGPNSFFQWDAADAVSPPGDDDPK